MLLSELINSSQIMKVKDSLNPLIWEGDNLKPEVRSKLIRIARTFEEFVGVDLDIVDYTITGSNANYTWTEHSDLDLHLVIPGTASDDARELYSAKKSLWGETRNITIKGLPVECYVQGQDEPHHSTGVYSLSKNAWLVEPQKIKPEVNDSSVEAKKDAIMHDIETAMLSKDLDKLQAVKERIVKMRQAGLDRAGEWSTENLVFKILRNLGLIEQITEKIRELEDQELSLEQQNNQLD
jgi:hypothetical protein